MDIDVIHSVVYREKRIKSGVGVREEQEGMQRDYNWFLTSAPITSLTNLYTNFCFDLSYFQGGKLTAGQKLDRV